MEKLMGSLEKFLLPIAQKISGNKYLQAISAGFMALMPVTIVGSIFYLIANFPIPAFTDWLAVTGLQSIISIVPTITLSLMAVYTVFLIAYRLAGENEIDALSSGVIALISFFVVTPFNITENGDTSYSFQWLGAAGLFVAILVGIISTIIVTWVIRKNWTIKLPEGVPPFVVKSFTSLIPAFFSVTFFLIIAGIFRVTTYGNIHEFIYNFLQVPLQNLGGSFGALLFAAVLIQLLWWFGIHGFNVVASVMMPIWISLDMERLAQIEAGQPITSFVGMSFMTAVGQSIFAILLTTLLVAKSKQLKGVAKIGLPAAIFNISEPMVFGLPTVLNPFLFIPTVLLIPIVTNVFFYIGFITGIVPPLSGAQIPMQMPVVLYGLVQGNWMLALWQLLAIPLAMVLIYPFIKMYDKQLLAKEQVNE